MPGSGSISLKRGWEPNQTQLRQELAALQSVQLAEVDAVRHMALASRLAAEAGKADRVTLKDLRLASRDALRALETGRHHYLNEDRVLAAQTLLALDRILLRSDERIDRQKDWAEDGVWQTFLSNYSDAPTRFGAGAYEAFVGGVQGLWDAFFGGAIATVAPLEDGDIRIHTLLDRSIGEARRSLGENFQGSRYTQMAGAYTAQTGQALPNRDMLVQATRSIMEAQESHPTDREFLAYMGDNPPLRRDVETLFRYLSVFGRPEFAEPAQEVLFYLDTDLYARRAASPIGEKSANFPRVDYESRDQVLPLLRSLMPQLWDLPEDSAQTQDQVNDRVWRIWTETWNQNGVDADDIMADLDDVVYQLSIGRFMVSGFGHEPVLLQDILVSFVALAMRDERPIAFASHSAVERISGMVNNPQMAAMRLALFLRAPEDPRINREEIEGFKGRHTYGSLTMQDYADLQAFKNANYNFEALERPAQLGVAMALTGGFGTIRGPKTYAGDSTRILIDDSLTKAQAYMAGGGMGAVVVGKRNNTDPIFLLQVVAEVKRAASQGMRVVADLRENGHESTPVDHRPTEVSYGRVSIATDYRHPTVSLWFRRNAMALGLRLQGRYREVMAEAQRIVNEAHGTYSVVSVNHHNGTVELNLPPVEAVAVSHPEPVVSAAPTADLAFKVDPEPARAPTTPVPTRSLVAPGWSQLEGTYVERAARLREGVDAGREEQPIESLQSPVESGPVRSVAPRSIAGIDPDPRSIPEPLRPHLAAALWAQTFRATRVSTLAVSDEVLRNFFARFGQGSHELIHTEDGVDYRGAIQRLRDGQSVGPVLETLLDEAENGGDNVASRVLEGFVAIDLLTHYQHLMGRGGALDLRDHYVPLWFELRAARDAARQVEDQTGSEHARELRAQFDFALRDLAGLYRALFANSPVPRPISKDMFEGKNADPTWRDLARLPREKVGIAFLGDRRELQHAVDHIPDDFPMVRVVDMPVAVTVTEVEGVSAPDETAIRASVRTMLANWGTGAEPSRPHGQTFPVERAFRSRLPNDPAAAPRYSVPKAAQIVHGFVTAMRVLLDHIGRGHAAEDEALTDFNTHLGQEAEYFMSSSGRSVHLDEESIVALEDAFVQAAREGREIVYVFTHESWGDIGESVAMLAGEPLRIAFKKELLAVPWLGRILTDANMIRLDRPKVTDNVDTNGLMRARAYLRVDEERARIQRLGTRALFYGPGSRNKTGGGVGENKKGAINLALDLRDEERGIDEALIVAINLTGAQAAISHFLPLRSSPMVQGLGTNLRMDAKVSVVDPRDHRPSESLEGTREGRSHQVNTTLAALQEVHNLGDVAIRARMVDAAAPIDWKDDKKITYSPLQIQTRFQLNRFLDNYAQALFDLDTGNYGALVAGGSKSWVDRNRVAFSWLLALRDAIPAEELFATYERAGIIFEEPTPLRAEALDQLFATAVPLVDTYEDNRRASSAARYARRMLNSYLDAFREPFLFMDLGQEDQLRTWAEAHQFLVDDIRVLRGRLEPAEVQGVYARAGINLFRRPADDQHADATLTIERMREEFFGPWLIRNIRSRAAQRVRHPLTPAPRKQVNIQVTEPSDEGLSFDSLQEAHQQTLADEYAVSGELIDAQLLLQSAAFRTEWTGFTGRIEAALAPAQGRLRNFVDDYAAEEHPDYTPVSQANGRLHQAVFESEGFDGLPPEYWNFAFYTLQAQDRYAQLVESSARAEEVDQARAHYYNLLGKGIEYRIKDDINSKLPKDPRSVGWADLPRYVRFAPRNIRLRNLADRVLIVTELLGQHRQPSLETALEEVNAQIEPIDRGWLKRQKPVSYRNTKLKQLYQRKAHLEYLVKNYGSRPLTEVLKDLASNGDHQIIFSMDLPQAGATSGYRAFLAANNSVSERLVAFEEAERVWIEASRADFDRWAEQKLELEKTLFRFSLAVHTVDRDLQLARYDDLMNQARARQTLSVEQEMRYAQARSQYELAMIEYLEISEEIAALGPRGKEPTRKKKETAAFIALTGLHWAVSDTFKEIGHPQAGNIRPFSAMFPNQIEIVNNEASDHHEGVKPFFDAITLELATALTMETVLGSQDPRRVGRIVGHWAVDVMGKSVSELQIMGSESLRDGMGQASGADLVGANVSVVDRGTTLWGVIPTSAFFDANHVGYSDLQMAALAYVTGLGKQTLVYERSNFEHMPIVGTAIIGADSVGFERERDGSRGLQAALLTASQRGTSPFIFGGGTMSVSTTPLPLWENALGAFVPRPYVMGSNLGESGKAAHTTGNPLLATWQRHPLAIHPDIGLSGNIREKNFDRPYGITAGSRPGGRAVFSFGDPFPGQAFPVTAAEFMDRLGIDVEQAGIPEGVLARQMMAAQVEIGRMMAHFKWLQGQSGESAPTPQTPRSVPRRSTLSSSGSSGTTAVAGAMVAGALALGAAASYSPNADARMLEPQNPVVLSMEDGAVSVEGSGASRLSPQSDQLALDLGTMGHPWLALEGWDGHAGSTQDTSSLVVVDPDNIGSDQHDITQGWRQDIRLVLDRLWTHLGKTQEGRAEFAQIVGEIAGNDPDNYNVRHLVEKADQLDASFAMWPVKYPTAFTWPSGLSVGWGAAATTATAPSFVARAPITIGR